jgi:hypothetical protein
MSLRPNAISALALDIAAITRRLTLRQCSGRTSTWRPSAIPPRTPASRRDHFRQRDDAWAVLYTNQNEVIAAMQKAAEAGIDSLAGRRLTQMRDFNAFPVDEIPPLLDRWHQHRQGE